MTLVVCKVRGSHIFILADTRITKQNVKLSPERGIIKTALLSPTTSISFSHSPELASRDIKTFTIRYQGIFSYSDALHFFENSSRDTGNDYLLAFLDPLRVVKVTEGKAMKVIGNRAWIGDYGAFHRFREYQSNKRKGLDVWEMITWPRLTDDPATSNAFSDLMSAFQSTLSDTEVLSAGDFYTVVTNVESNFKFLTLAKLYYDGLGPYPVTPKSGENFDYRFSVLVPKRPSINACAFYYPHAQRGYIFYGILPYTVADQCTVARHETEASFLELCQAVVGIEFDYSTVSHYPPGQGIKG
jgi:hypothetical protein